MGDEDKRGARKFEPPPWEKDAFEVLARKKAEEQEALEVLAAAPAAPPAPAADERQVQVMLLELGREETAPTGHIQLVSRIASLVTGIAGTGMVIGGISALQKAGTTPVGVMGSSALSVFGLCFVGMAVWVWVRSNRVRGSL